MINNIQPTSPGSDSNRERVPEQGEKNQTRQSESAKESDAAASSASRNDLRMVIEKDQSGFSFVYRLIDPITGDVVVEIPREDLRKLGEAPNYRAGSVVSTKA